MKVEGLEIVRCDGGWRNYHFLKLTTDEGIVGWSEFDEGFGSPGVSAVVEQLAGRVIARLVFDHERIYTELYCVTRPAAGGVVGEGLGAIENALLDAKAKALEVPCYALLGGKMRDRIPVYWSHCATWRINHPTFFTPAITSLDGVKAIGAEVREKGFTALKTNIFLYEDGAPRAWRPGFGVPFLPDLNVEKNVLRNLHSHLEAIRDGAGPNVDLLLDLNFNAKTEGYLKILKAIADFDMFWVEIDCYSPRGARLSPPAQPTPDQLVRNSARVARVPALFPRAGDGRRDHRRRVERCVASDEDRGHGQCLRGQHRPAQFLRPSRHDDERAFCSRNAEFAHHGNRYRPAGLGSRSVHQGAAVRERVPRPPRHSRLGHRAERGSNPGSSAESAGRSDALPAVLTTAGCRPVYPKRSCDAML
jgi:hypothetical protein